MEAGANPAPTASGWTIRHAVLWVGMPFVIGITLGVFVRRLEVAGSLKTTGGAAQQTTQTRSAQRQNPPGQLRSLADKEAEPLLAELKSKPDDPVLLAKVGNIYYVTKDFKQACTFFQRSLEIKDDATLRTELGRAYFYSGDAEGALAEFEKVLKSDPDNANAMFNVGMVKWQSKFDVDGAIAAWQEILKKHPNHPRRAEVEKLIARAKQHRNVKQPAQTGEPPL